MTNATYGIERFKGVKPSRFIEARNGVDCAAPSGRFSICFHFPRALPWAGSCTGPSGRREDDVLGHCEDASDARHPTRRRGFGSRASSPNRVDAPAILLPRLVCGGWRFHGDTGSPTAPTHDALGRAERLTGSFLRPEGPMQLPAPGTAWGWGTPPINRPERAAQFRSSVTSRPKLRPTYPNEFRWHAIAARRHPSPRRGSAASSPRHRLGPGSPPNIRPERAQQLRAPHPAPPIAAPRLPMHPVGPPAQYVHRARDRDIPPASQCTRAPPNAPRPRASCRPEGAAQLPAQGIALGKTST